MNKTIIQHKKTDSENLFRAPAVPLITIDPYFNIWSFTDKLYEDDTRHWTGNRNSMLGLISVDGVWHRFMGKVEKNNKLYYTEPTILEQTDLKVLPLETVYTFENEKIILKLTFTSPLIASDPDLMSRPISYISYSISSKDKEAHDIQIYFDISCEAVTDSPEQTLNIKKTEKSICFGRGDCDVLKKSGDNIGIDWGYLHLSAPDFTFGCLNTIAKKQMLFGDEYNEVEGVCSPDDDFPSLYCMKEYKDTLQADDYFCIGYDDIYSIELFKEKAKCYCYRNGETFNELMNHALSDYSEIKKQTIAFQEDIINRANKISAKYCDIISLAYRQTIAAHKLVHINGETYFLSKECYSNGCIGTVDVTYPSIPLFLLYNPDLVCAMLNPIFKYAESKEWTFDFAPHDIGTYPIANGQMYGYDKTTKELQYDMQMPVEECGNMLLCVAAVCNAKNDFSYAKKHKEILTKWADYLTSNGWNPKNQLCTDDFAGHLAENCNLSIKSILGIAAWGNILNKIGEEQTGNIYIEKAKEFAAAFKEAGFDNDHYKLAFNQPDTWSIKYNLVWDSILNLDIFDKAIAKTEIKYYKEKINKYGLPLDSRSDYSKSDWQLWSCRLTDDEDYRNSIINAMWDMLCDTPDRVPFTDWYFTSVPMQKKYVPTKDQGREYYQIGFQNRTVQGGLYILMI